LCTANRLSIDTDKVWSLSEDDAYGLSVDFRLADNGWLTQKSDLSIDLDQQARETEVIESQEVPNDRRLPPGSLPRIMKRVRLTVVYRTSREVRSYSIKAFTKKSRHLKLLRYLQKQSGSATKKRSAFTEIFWQLLHNAGNIRANPPIGAWPSKSFELRSVDG
jgi:hypothetical protein